MGSGRLRCVEPADAKGEWRGRGEGLMEREEGRKGKRKRKGKRNEKNEESR